MADFQTKEQVFHTLNSILNTSEYVSYSVINKQEYMYDKELFITDLLYTSNDYL